MLLSDKTKEAADKALAAMSSPVRSAMLNATVKLEGKNPSNFTFTGSGVILYADATHTWIVTAKHNLYIYDGKTDPPAWSDDIVTSFRDRIKIYYDGPQKFDSDPGRTAVISEIIPVKIGGDDKWGYDVMIVKSTDGDLRGFASIHYITDLDEIRAATRYLTDARQYLKRAGQSFIQMGYGSITDRAKETLIPTGDAAGNHAGHLQYRSTAPAAEATVTVYDPRTDDPSVYESFEDAIQITANENSSTAKGDSGGPLFVAFYTKTTATWSLFLIGITTGADMDTRRARYPTGKTLRGNNIATSLKYCYENSLFE